MATAAFVAIMLMTSSCDVIIVDSETELELEVNANNISGKFSSSLPTQSIIMPNRKNDEVAANIDIRTNIKILFFISFPPW